MARIGAETLAGGRGEGRERKVDDRSVGFAGNRP